MRSDRDRVVMPAHGRTWRGSRGRRARTGLLHGRSSLGRLLPERPGACNRLHHPTAAMITFTPMSRKIFVSAAMAGLAGTLLAAQPSPRRRLGPPRRGRRSPRRTGPHQDRPRSDHRQGRPAPVRQLRRAPGPDDLRRHLRREEPALGSVRLPQGRHGRREGARRLDPALARRQLRLRLQLEGRHRPEGPAAGPARARLERRRDQPLRHRRVPALRRDDQGASRTSASISGSAPSATRATGSNTPTARSTPTGRICAARTATTSRTT